MTKVGFMAEAFELTRDMLWAKEGELAVENFIIRIEALIKKWRKGK